jgi:uncharacterized protein
MLAALVVAAQLVSVTDLASPRPDHWVLDHADVLAPEEEARLDAIAQELYTTRSVELAFVVVGDIKGKPKDFATRLFAHWKIGDARTNNGILVLLVMGARRLEIEVGTGMEAALTSAWLAYMQEQEMVPKFKTGDFAGGLLAGAHAIRQQILTLPGEGTGSGAAGEYRSDGVVTATSPGSGAGGGNAVRIPPRSPSDPPPQPYVYTPTPEEEPSRMPLVVGGLGVLGAAGGGLAMLRRRRRRQRTCTHCQPPQTMLALDEIADDARLDPGQKTEEQVGAVDYEVVVCPGCQASRTFRHGKWFSGYGKCGACGYKTCRSSSETIVHATYDHGGQVRITEDCAHCNHHSERIRYTSARTRPSTTSSSFGSSGSSRSSYSSSSSSRSSGFGGGSSRGGGAGSSW